MKYLCIHYKTEKTERCKDCCGATNLCGFYENALGEDPFYTKRKTVEEIIKDARLQKMSGMDKKSL